MSVMNISVVVPVFNSEKCLPELDERLEASLKKISGGYEIIYVDDGSSDKSWQTLNLICRTNKNRRIIKLVKNYGQHVAITAGVSVVDSNWLVVMDCDLQDRPEDIVDLYNLAIAGFDVVVAKKINRNHGVIKNITAKLFYISLSFLSGVKLDPYVGNFRIISREVVESFKKYKQRARFFIGIIDSMGYDTGYVNVHHDARRYDKSTYTISKLIKLAFEIMITSSSRPLKMSAVIGGFLCLVSITLLIIVALMYTFGQVTVSGWTTIILLTSGAFSFTMFQLSLIGLYLERIFNEAQAAPLFLVKNDFKS